MPRTYKRKLGSRPYANYSKETLQQCLADIRGGRLTQREAASHFNIPRRTLRNKLKGKFSNKPGHPTVFSREEEEAFVNHIITLSDCGFPVDELDFRFIVKSYLTRKGWNVKQFKDNLPGRDWVKLFVKRHQVLSTRFAANVKRARAAVNENVIEEYVDNLSKEIQHIRPEHIWNYDETNLCDDPGQKKVICKRGTKYPERILNTSKSSVSVMFCGNAAGEIIPPYVVYKADHLWSTWTENGPPGTRYNRTKHGWFDGATFENWFVTHLFPVLKKAKQEHQVIIGDNLSSHINYNILKMCEENSIKFICLPPNSTHLTQPLDVGFFAPMKKLWRNILNTWKCTADGSKFTTMPKDHFPTLLKQLVEEMKPTAAQNLISGFRKCGIVPLNKTELLGRLPYQRLQGTQLNMVGEALLSKIQENRKEAVKNTGQKVRHKKLNVPPGQSICTQNVQEPEASSSSSPMPMKKKRRRAKKKNSPPTSSEESSDEFSLASSSDSEISFDILEPEEDFEFMITEDSGESAGSENLETGNFVLVNYNEHLYPGIVVCMDEKEIEVDCMEKKGKYWKWPARKDIMKYPWKDVKKRINPPIKMSRGFFRVPELE